MKCQKDIKEKYDHIYFSQCDTLVVNIVLSHLIKHQVFLSVHPPVAWQFALQICFACECRVLLYLISPRYIIHLPRLSSLRLNPKGINLTTKSIKVFHVNVFIYLPLCIHTIYIYIYIYIYIWVHCTFRWYAYPFLGGMSRWGWCCGDTSHQSGNPINDPVPVK